MSRKQRKERRKADRAASKRLQSMLDAQPVGELSKFWTQAGTTFLISGLLAIIMVTIDHCQTRAADRLRTTAEAVAARRDALEQFGARLHGIVEAHYDALLAEQAWFAQRALISAADAGRIEKQTTLGFAKKLVSDAPPPAKNDVAGLRLAERLYADFIVKRDLAIKAGSGQALCVALMSRLRTPESRETVAALSAALRDLENGRGLPDPSGTDSGIATDAATALASTMDSPTDHVHDLVRRVSDALDQTYQEICHELSSESFALWADLDEDWSLPGLDLSPQPDRLRLERRHPHEGDARGDRTGDPVTVARGVGHGARGWPAGREQQAGSD